MSIETTHQPQHSAETNPFSATPEEIAAREALFAPDVDYSALSTSLESLPQDTAPDIEIPKLEVTESHEPAPLPKRFSDNLLPVDKIPQLADDDAQDTAFPEPEKLESNLLPADQIPQLEPDQERTPRHRL